MQAVLVMFRSDGERRSFSVTRDVTVIGRRDDCDLRIPLGDVSRKHARLIRDGDTLRLEDFGSSNGTYLNGQRVERDAVLQAGDSIQVGPVVFVLQVDGYPSDEELNPITAESAAGDEGGGFGAAALGAAGGVALGAAGAAELGLDDDESAAAPAGGEYADGGELDEFDPLAELPAAEGGVDGEEPTLELGHAGDEGMDLTEPAAGGELGIGEDPLALDEDPLAPGGDQAIPLAGDDQPIGLAEDNYEPIPLAGGGPAAQGEPLAEGELLGEGELADGGLELTDESRPGEGGEDAGLDDLLIDIEPEPPKKR